MTAVIAYGSLINPEQQRSSLFLKAWPVRVQGYRRVFNQEPSWRQGDRTHRAVLNVTKSNEDWFNGVLVNLPDSSSLDELDKRERGYDRVAIASSQLAYFNENFSGFGAIAPKPTANPTYLYLGKAEKQNNNILPNKDYLALCLRGAQHWGNMFYQQFLQTTYVGQHTLETFLQQ